LLRLPVGDVHISTMVLRAGLFSGFLPRFTMELQMQRRIEQIAALFSSSPVVSPSR
jgi:hypothetical protein